MRREKYNIKLKVNQKKRKANILHPFHFHSHQYKRDKTLSTTFKEQSLRRNLLFWAYVSLCFERHKNRKFIFKATLVG